jgi:dynein heavy chain
MNPKAITAEEMYGVVNPVSNEWQSGVFAEIWKRSNKK